MILYNSTDIAHGILLFRWWTELHSSGDIVGIFPERDRAVQTLYKLMEPPMILMFEYDEHGLWFAAWLSPTLSSAFYSMWIRTDMRSSQAAFMAGIQAYDAALEMFPVLMGITVQEKLLPVHRLVGYTILDPIPELVDGKKAWLVILTRDGYAAHRDGLIAKAKSYNKKV